MIWFEFQGVVLNAAYKMKDTQPSLIEYFLNVFNIFDIIIWYEKNYQPDTIGIMRKS